MVQYELTETISRLIPRGPPPNLPPRNSLVNNFNPTPERDHIYDDLAVVATEPVKPPERSRKSTIIFSLIITVVILIFIIFFATGFFTSHFKLSVFSNTLDECTDEYVFYEETGYCYKVTLRPAQFESAREVCESENGHLVSVHSKKENYFLENLYDLKLEESKQFEKSGVWLGLVGHNGPHFKWTDGTKIDFTNWGSDNTRYPEKNWVVMDGTAWMAVEDRRSNSFICKRPSRTMEKTKEEAEIIKNENTNLNCTDDYVYFNITGFCYKVSTAEMAFRDAEESCRSENGHLASVHSINEHYFLIGLYHVKLATDLLEKTTKFWLGLWRFNDQWQYTDKSSKDFDNFPKTEKDQETHGDYVVIDGNYWNVTSKHQKHPFICKKSARERIS